jgi:hypothetical protein
MAQKALLPLRMGTRQRFQKVGTVAFAAGQAGATLELPRVGLANRLVIQFRGTVTATASAVVLGLDSPWSLLSRLRVNLNTGSASIIDVTGFGAFCMQRTLNEFTTPRGFTVIPQSNTISAPGANATADLAFTLVLPLAVNNGDAFGLGSINLQAPEVRMTLETVFGNLSDVGANVASVTGALHVGYLFYEVPPLDQYALPPLALCRMLEESQSITNTGENVYTVPRMGSVLSLAHLIYLNGQRSDSFEEVGIRLNKSDTPYRIERGFQRAMECYSYGDAPNSGLVIHDFFRAYEASNMGDMRDAIDSEEVSTLESFVTVSSGATLGAGNNTLRTVRRILQVLEG